MKRISKGHSLAATVSLFLLIAPGAAKTANDTFGAGLHTCAVFANAYREETTMGIFYFSWAQGYMSGLNLGLMGAARLQGLQGGAAAQVATDLGLMSFDGQERHIRHYCDRHPLNDYMDAVLNLFNTMRGKQGLSTWPTQ